MLGRQRAIKIVPSGKPLGWRRYDVPQHLAPEASDALRFCAVEGDLELLDRRHRPTIEVRAATARKVAVSRDMGGGWRGPFTHARPSRPTSSESSGFSRPVGMVEIV